MKRKFPSLPGVTVVSQPEEGIALETEVDEMCYVEIGVKTVRK
jgi:hypothetical protein